MAKRADFTFHAMDTLRAWITHTSLLVFSDPGALCQLESTSSPEAILEQPALSATAMEAHFEDWALAGRLVWHVRRPQMINISSSVR